MLESSVSCTMDDKGNYISQSCSSTLDENYSSAVLGDQDNTSTGDLDCTTPNEHISLVSVSSENIQIVDGKKSVIMIDGQVSTVIESQPAAPESLATDGKIESGNSSCHQDNTFGESNSVNSNYYVLVEGSDGSQVISQVIPSILPGNNDEPQLALNAVLQSDISYINSSSLSEAKDQNNYSSETVTMIIDPNLQVQESRKIFIDPSLTNINSQNISAEQLAILDKGSSHTFDEDLSQKSIVVDTSLLSSQYQTVQVSSHKKDDSCGHQIRIIDVSNWDSNNKQVIGRPLDLITVQSTEVEKQLKEEQRQMSLRLLEQSHLQHQEKLLHRRNTDENKDVQLKSDGSEKLLKQAGIDDDTPIFSHISAKINPDLLAHVPGCQRFLLSEAARKTSSVGVTFSSDLDCSFTGEVKDFVSLHTRIKNLLKLLSPTNLVFEKCKEVIKKENKNIGCNLLVPYVSSKGRLSKQSSKLMQMGGLLNLDEFLSGTELIDGKGDFKKQKRGCRKRTFFSKYKGNSQEGCDISTGSEQIDDHLSTLHVKSDTEKEDCTETQSENIESFPGPDYSQCINTANPNFNDPIQRHLHEEQIKCKQMCDESRGKHMKIDVPTQISSIEDGKEEAAGLQSDGSSNTRRANKGRPPKKFDPSETVGKVKPRNPLTESLETKQRRVYEEHVSFKFFCDQCSFKSKRRSQFDHHLTFHEKGTIVKHFCRHCDFISISLPSLKQHELLHKKNVLKCAICSVYITDKKHLMQKHMRQKHSGKPVTTVEKSLSCNQCSATFASRIMLGRHKASHLNSQIGQSTEITSSNVCPHCKKTFGKKIHLHRHLKDVHGPQLRPHLCDKCGRSFKRKDALQQHRITHLAKSARVLPFKCNKCDKAFRSQAHLKEHSAIHSSDRPFLCQYCGASFKTQPVQKKHILTLHLQPRTHVCAVCCRQFNTKHALQRHENTHKPKDANATDDDAIRSWESVVIDTDDIKKLENKETGSMAEVSANSMIVSIEEDQSTAALVVKTEGGTQVMVDPSLVPAMMASSEAIPTSEGTRTLEVSQALIQAGQADQAFYYLSDDQL